uniref:Uncharacterized protein n=1 Tax=Strongyloides venezuelensis TaxID=75913 RepID=A0A0K0EZZ0_STRVS
MNGEGTMIVNTDKRLMVMNGRRCNKDNYTPSASKNANLINKESISFRRNNSEEEDGLVYKLKDFALSNSGTGFII